MVIKKFSLAPVVLCVVFIFPCLVYTAKFDQLISSIVLKMCTIITINLVYCMLQLLQRLKNKCYARVQEFENMSRDI